MGRVKAIEIKESTQELLQLSKKAKHPVAQARLRAFYLYKSGQLKRFADIAQEVGYERHAVGKWFKLYQQQGLQACLEIDPGGNPHTTVLIEGKVLEELLAKLQHPTDYFTSYVQIHQWLLEQHHINISYAHTQRFVHTKLGARLKVVRKSNLKKDVAKEEKLKKN